MCHFSVTCFSLHLSLVRTAYVLSSIFLFYLIMQTKCCNFWLNRFYGEEHEKEMKDFFSHLFHVLLVHTHIMQSSKFSCLCVHHCTKSMQMYPFFLLLKIQKIKMKNQPPATTVVVVVAVGLINHFGKRDNVFLAALMSILCIF